MSVSRKGRESVGVNYMRNKIHSGAQIYQVWLLGVRHLCFCALGFEILAHGALAYLVHSLPINQNSEL